MKESARRSRSGSPSRGDSGVEVPGGDLPGCVGDPPEWPQQPAARPPPDAGGQQHGDGRADDEGEQDRAQGPLGGAEPEGLVVVGIDVGDVDADADVVLVAEVEALDPRDADVDRLAKLTGEALERELGVGAGPLGGGQVDGGEPARLRADRPEERAELVLAELLGAGPQLLAHPEGVEHGLLARQLGALLEQGGPGECVRHDGE